MDKHIPLRQCVGCRSMKPKRELVRLLRLKDGSIVFDSTGKLSGRGAYICNSVCCFDKAVKAGAFNRALDTNVPAAVLEDVRNRVMMYE